MNALDSHLQRQRQRLSAAGVEQSDVLDAVVLCSDFTVDVLCAQPESLRSFQSEHVASIALEVTREQAMRDLRRWRAVQSARLVWRDAGNLDSTEQILQQSTQIADVALNAALRHIENELINQFGVCRNKDGAAQRLCVFGLGKLGGEELNFSSDVDLVYAYRENGESDGPRRLEAEAYFTRLGQALFKLMDDVTADGFVHRMDLRLRPFGASGRLVYSAAAMDHYFQREGRDWERYAWLKARSVAGDIICGDEILRNLRPFVYRRYLDYTALDGLREMKALIAAQVEKKEMAEDLKRGPGGIREIEFLVQAQQLIRGGREKNLQQRRLLPAMQALAEAGHMKSEDANNLRNAYLFLRQVENRVQMLADAQTHSLPDDELQAARIVLGLGYADRATFDHELKQHREVVSEAFAQLLQTQRRRANTGEWSRYWQSIQAQSEDHAPLLEAGFKEPVQTHGLLLDLARSSLVRQLTARAKQRFDSVMLSLLAYCASNEQPDTALQRCVQLLKSILRRTNYLALLEEQPIALERMVHLGARSAWIAERLAAHPILFDELLDVRAAGPVPDKNSISEALSIDLSSIDTEQALQELNEIKQTLSFRLAIAWQMQRVTAQECAKRLAHLAESVLREVTALALADTQRHHGKIEGASFAAIGYGSLGGEELGFNSDLDVVFLYDAPLDAQSDGARPMDASRYYTRVAQKIMSLLNLITPAGRLYEIDLRLRPDGSKGLPVIALRSFIEYQLERAWTWEHQALVRARAVAGDKVLLNKFNQVRAQVLQQVRDQVSLQADVINMRQRMRQELDRTDAKYFDLKQGAGGLVDLEFVLQYLVLNYAHQYPALVSVQNTQELIFALAGLPFVSTEFLQLGRAHGDLLQAGLGCTLDLAPRRVRHSEPINQARALIAQEFGGCLGDVRTPLTQSFQ
jgi:[glutamine synthetase] adenylyltransferase / [glutamine synthetase]-adenylyl-L-tyrosine phosphorylase